jgi:predicted extracellular nuclease
MRRPLPSLLPLCGLLRMFASAMLASAMFASAVSAQEAPMAIGEIQGSGERSPRIGDSVVVEGIVTATPGLLGGWFLQDAGDGDPATSDALFVAHTPDATLTLAPDLGQHVRVRGTVVELDTGRGTRTALQHVDVRMLGKGKVRAVAIAAPPADWERYENMRVRIAAPLIVAGTDRGKKYGELMVNFGDRLRTPADAAKPGDDARALAADNARRMLRLDDGSDAEQPATIWYLPKSGLPRTGVRVSRVEGVLDQRGNGYRLQLTAKPVFRRMSLPPAPRVGGDLRIASFNLENFFNGDGHGGGFPTPRGARTQIEFDTQLARLVATIHGLNPDIAALMELENDGFGPDSSIATLVMALNREGDDWRFVATDAGLGGDQIRVGLIYRASRVSPVGEAATLVDDLFGKRSRPPLAQTFRAGTGTKQGPAFTVIANHFKSKGCGDAAGADADLKDGQSCWNATRTESARRLDAWLRTDPTGSGSDLAMIVGDLNAYSMEDPIQTLISTGWRDAFAEQRGPAPYSYVYDSLVGRLDHALLSPSLAARLVGAAEWHSNADEPGSQGGYRERPDDRSARRSSDHDPLVVGFRLRKP